MQKTNNKLTTAAESELTRLFPDRLVKRVLLVSPPDVDADMFDYSTAKRGRCWNYPPYGLGIVAALLKKSDIYTDIVNLNHEELRACRNSKSEGDFDFESVWRDVLLNKIQDVKPDMIGLTCMFTQTHGITVKVIKEIKRLYPQIPIALGGVHITNCFIDAKTTHLVLEDLEACDLFFLYESEFAFNTFVKVVNNELQVKELYQVYFNSTPEKLYFLNKIIPLEGEIDIVPSHDLMSPSKLASYGKVGSFYCMKGVGTKFTTVLSNRGCRGQCSFCSVRNFNGAGVRHRAVQSVIDELVMLRDEYGIDHVMWLDDDFFHNTKKTLLLLNEMVRQNVGLTWDCTNGVIASSCTDEVIDAAAKSGCIGLTIGVESGNPRILKIIKKPGSVDIFLRCAQTLKKYEKINARVFLMIGFPGETYQMISDTFNLAIKMDLDWYNITIFQPLPNTVLFDRMTKNGVIKDVEFENIRYNAGPYGKIREKAQKGLYSSKISNDIFKGCNIDEIPPKPQLEDIWFNMNYHLNFKRLFKLERPVKLEQQFRYVQNIADIVAPDDAFVMYFCGYMQKKILGSTKSQVVKKLEECLNASPNWRGRFNEFNLSLEHVKTGVFPDAQGK